MTLPTALTDPAESHVVFFDRRTANVERRTSVRPGTGRRSIDRTEIERAVIICDAVRALGLDHLVDTPS